LCIYVVNKEINRNFIETVLYFHFTKTKYKADRLANPTVGYEKMRFSTYLVRHVYLANDKHRPRCYGTVLDKKVMLSQGNRAMPQLFFFGLKFADNIHRKFKSSQASKARLHEL